MSLQYYDDSTGQLVEQVDLGGVAQESSIQALKTLVTTLQSRGAVKSVQKGSYHSMAQRTVYHTKILRLTP